jgi:tetratricopeptide (TPR) repeat protein
MAFIDEPGEMALRAILAEWDYRPLPRSLEWALGCIKSREMPWHPEPLLELRLVNWLYDVIRLNIKRGPVYRMDDALRVGKADCLAYSKIFTVLGRRLGLDAGVVDVLIDCGGRNNPHTAVLANLRGGKVRFLDLWYGCKNVRHRRVGLRVLAHKVWVMKDVDLAKTGGLTITSLAERSVNGITRYVRGNAHLSRGEYREATEDYDGALKLYPQMVRPHYNRAIAYEQIGEPDRAQADYAASMRNENALVRVAAREYKEITDLARLDEANIGEKEQEMYLLHKGIITGRIVSTGSIARRLRLSEAEVVDCLAEVERAVRAHAT